MKGLDYYPFFWDISIDPSLGDVKRQHQLYKKYPSMNSDDYHGKSRFHESPDVVALGECQTSASALPRAYTWPYIGAMITGEKVNLVTKPTTPNNETIYLLGEALLTFNKPHKIRGLFMNIIGLRDLKFDISSCSVQHHELMWIPAASAYIDVWMTINGITEPKPDDLHIHTDFMGNQYKVTMEPAAFIDLISIEHLNLFCEINAIDFKFAAWSYGTDQTFSKSGLANYISPSKYESRGGGPSYGVVGRKWGDPYGEDCGHRPESSSQSQAWIVGSDRWHAGLHHQIHFAEELFGIEITQKNLQTIDKMLDISDTTTFSSVRE